MNADSNVLYFCSAGKDRTKLADVSLFTFEPHISASGSKYGYKRENIYCFDKEGLKEL